MTTSSLDNFHGLPPMNSDHRTRATTTSQASNPQQTSSHPMETPPRAQHLPIRTQTKGIPHLIYPPSIHEHAQPHISIHHLRSPSLDQIAQPPPLYLSHHMFQHPPAVCATQYATTSLPTPIRTWLIRTTTVVQSKP